MTHISDDESTLLVIGASARAAAWSARRAFQHVHAIDQFGDDDLRDMAAVVRVSTDDPNDLPAVAASLPPGPWMYTGALENHPDVVGSIAAVRPLLGNGANVLAGIRDPFRIAAVLESNGLPCPSVRRYDDPPPRDGTWVLKPRRGAAGRGIAVWSPDTRRPRGADYFQRRIAGRSFSAVFVGDGTSARLVGASWQFFRHDDPERPTFEWAGNGGAIELTEPTHGAVAAIGRALAREFGLRGLFGGDFVLDGEAPLLVEVNPRYTASVEVLERSLGLDLVTAHVAGCAGVLNAHDPDPAIRQQRAIVKRILFADRPIDATPPLETVELPVGVSIADRPSPGTRIATGEPICTLLVEAPDVGTGLRTAGEFAVRLLNLLRR